MYIWWKKNISKPRPTCHAFQLFVRENATTPTTGRLDSALSGILQQHIFLAAERFMGCLDGEDPMDFSFFFFISKVNISGSQPLIFQGAMLSWNKFPDSYLHLEDIISYQNKIKVTLNGGLDPITTETSPGRPSSK